MNITIKNILDSKEALERLAVEKLPVRTSYNLGKFLKAVNKELEIFNEFRNELLNKYGERQEDNTYKIDSGNIQKFNDEVIELINIEVHFDFELLLLDSLGNVSISSQDMLALDYLIKES